MAAVADRHHVHVDTVFDLNRMMRAPGTWNNKGGNGTEPILVVAHAEPGAPLTVAEIIERLDEYGVPERDTDREYGRDEISPPSGWQWANKTCPYVLEMVSNFGTDAPQPGGGRNPWAFAQHIRLACAYRLGCISEGAYRAGRAALAARLDELVRTTEPRRQLKKLEIADLRRYSIERAAAKTDEQARAELGDHRCANQVAGVGTHAKPGPVASNSRTVPSGVSPASDEPVDDSAEAADTTEAYIEHLRHKLRCSREAKRRLDDEEHPQVTPPPVKSLPALLDEPEPVTKFRIDDVAPIDSRVILSAQFKAGKSVIVGNLMRALADADLFLGRFAVNTSRSRVVLIDDEMSENRLRRWLRDQNFANPDSVVDVVSLRGRVGAFNLLDDRRRAEWSSRLADLGCDYLILDCLRPVLDTLGLDENRETGRFLVEFDTLLADAGISDALLVHHMGHANERARGDSRLEDWPDVIWRIVREAPDDPNSPRYFSAVGRDVNVPEGRLGYDPGTRRLTYAAGSRSDAKTEAATSAIITLLAGCALTDTPGLSKAAIERELSPPHTQSSLRDGLALAVARGRVTQGSGPRGAKVSRIAYPCAQCGLPVLDKTERHLACPASVEELPL